MLMSKSIRRTVLKDTDKVIKHPESIDSASPLPTLARQVTSKARAMTTAITTDSGVGRA
jgi:hypothetical protein